MSAKEEFIRRYQAAAHAVQTGVAYELERDESSGTPKHLRTGVNLALVQNAAIAELLMQKGVFSEEEYWEMIATKTEEERDRYQQLLSDRFEVSVKLG
jgi:hypothetical protein